jgi:hypothetical protein
MIAFGGKRENGALKENSDCIPDLGTAGADVALLLWECEDRSEMNVRKTTATNERPAMRILGGLMMLRSLRDVVARNLISSAAGGASNGSHPNRES